MIRTPLALACTFSFLVLPALADDRPAQPERKPFDKLVERFSLVVQKDVQEKLNLTNEQKKKLNKLQLELNLKNLQLLGKAGDLKEKLEKATEKPASDSESPDLKTSALEAGMLTLEFLKMRSEIDARFRDILTDDQKKLYDELKSPLPRPRRDRPKKEG
jgi:hypothetical protein